MKIRFLSILFMAASISVFAQKKEIKDAEKAVENENYTEALEFLNAAESDVSSLNDRWQSRYYLTLADAYYGNNKAGENLEELSKAAENYAKAEELGNNDAQEKKFELLQTLIESGIESQNTQNFEDAYKKMVAAYEISPTDTIYLFAAAGNAFNANDDQAAIELHERLLDIGYRGDVTQYFAVESSSGEKQAFPDKAQRDLMVKAGEYKDPTDEKEDRKDGDIIKQLAILYLRNEERDKAIEAIERAKEANPGDSDIYLAEAQVYLEMDNREKFLEIIEDLVSRDPDNAGEYYRILGHAAVEDGDLDKGEDFYNKAIAENADEREAYSGLANILLKKQEGIVEEMNELGMSAEDEKKYDELQEKRLDLLKEAIPHLEKAHELDKEDLGPIRTLYNIHRQLKNTEEAEKYRALMD